MKKFIIILYMCILQACRETISADTPSELENLYAESPSDLVEQPPTVLLALLVRNKAHVLPLFFTYLERLNYPKQRMALWIRSDHNIDASGELIELWLNHTATLYHSVDYSLDNDTQSYESESSPFDWPAARYLHIMHLKDAAMKHARKIWADYIFHLDVDVLLTNADTLSHLTNLRLPIVAPMLYSQSSYSNFRYNTTDDYMYTYNSSKEDVFQVNMVHSAVLVNLNYVRTRYLTFNREMLIEQQQHLAEWAALEGKQCRSYDGPINDIIVFGISANCSQIPLFVSSKYPYGYILQPINTSGKLKHDQQQLINIRVNIILDIGAVEPVNQYFEKYMSFPEKTKLTLDHIYMINLERRPERRKKMETFFNEIGLDVEYFAGVDGKNLSLDVIQSMGISFLPGYEDPFEHLPMKMGEVGCFLSHYHIWEKMVENNQNEVLILEDDIRLIPYFKEIAIRVINQARSVAEYNLIYFGRKLMVNQSEPGVKGTENLVHVGYSHWTLAYVITLQGAKKLLAAKPLEKLLPVDEFLPVMFNRHPNKTWSAAFSQRNLIAFSSAPLILYPILYNGQEGFTSDTENIEINTQGADG